MLLALRVELRALVLVLVVLEVPHQHPELLVATELT
jgi:hypothetical protein